MSERLNDVVDVASIDLAAVARAVVVERPLARAPGSFMPDCACGAPVARQYGLSLSGGRAYWLEVPFCSTPCVERYLNRD